MVGLAQLVSASGCGPEGRGFESHISPQKKRKAPHGPGESPSVQVSKDRQQTRRPSGHLHTGRCFLPNKALRGRKKESTPRRADRKTESGCSAVGSARGLGPRCRRFESCHSDQKSAENEVFAPLSADFMLIIGFYPPPRKNPLTAEKRLVP